MRELKEGMLRVSRYTICYDLIYKGPQMVNSKVDNVIPLIVSWFDAIVLFVDSARFT